MARITQEKVYKVTANHRTPGEFQRFRTVGFIAACTTDLALEDAKESFKGEAGLAVEPATEQETKEFWS